MPYAGSAQLPLLRGIAALRRKRIRLPLSRVVRCSPRRRLPFRLCFAAVGDLGAPKRSVVSDAQMAELLVERHGFHGDWNYTVRPLLPKMSKEEASYIRSLLAEP